MFLEFYNLREHPFGVTPDPRFLYLSAGHREALAALLCGIETGRGFLGLVAQAGMGKTTLVFELLEQLKRTSTTVFLFQTQCDSRELLGYLLRNLGVETAGQDIVTLHEQLNELLAREMVAQRKFVLVIDEAQNLEDSVLETVRLLSDFETPSAKLVQIVLVGQPRLAEKLAGPSLVQLRQRMAILGQLQPFTAAETAAYISHRLQTAGYEGGPLFTPGALEAIAAKSGGIPRNINTLCFNALALGYGLGRPQIDAAMIAEVVADLDVQAIAQNKRPAPRLAPSPVARNQNFAAPIPPPVPAPASSFAQTDSQPLRADASVVDVFRPSFSSSSSANAPRPAPFAKPAFGAPEKERSYGVRILGVLAIAAALVFLFGPYFSSSGTKPEEDAAEPQTPAVMAAPSDPSTAPPAENAASSAESEGAASPADAAPTVNAEPSTSKVEQAPVTSADLAGLVVVVAPKQTLRQICLLHLGRYDHHLIEVIRGLNPQLVDPNHLQAGQEILLPQPAASGARRGASR
jgi:type II secretory pathway predicted ATPase ExeA